MKERLFPSGPRPWILVLALVVLYVASARLGLELALPPEKKATAVWPPSGIAFAAVLLFGARVWPGIWLGAFLANLWDYFDPAGPFPLATHLGVSSGIAVGSTLQALLGAALLRRWVDSPRPFDRAGDVFKFVGVALLMCLVAATCGVASLWLGGFAPLASAPFVWWTWWLGDTAGVLILTPLLLSWGQPARLAGGRRRLAEVGVLLGLLAGTGLFVFGERSPWGGGSSPLAYLTVPFLVWAAFRFGQRGATTALLLLAAVAVWGTTQGSGPFVRGTLNEALLQLLTFVSILSVTALAMAAVLTERGHAEAEARALKEQYEVLYDQAPDMYVSVDSATARVLRCNQTLAAATGYAKEEILGRPLFTMYHPDYLEDARKAIQALATTGQVHNAELQLRRKDGSRLDVSLEGTAVRDAQGRLLHGQLSCRDVTERKRAERRRNARLAVTQILAQAAPLAEAAPQILRVTCTNLGWDFGAFWTVDGDGGVLRCLATWHPASFAVEEFAASTRHGDFAPGVGLPGRVWVSGETAWVPDVVVDANFPRAAVAAQAGLHAALGCPVRDGGEVLGVMEFFSADIRQPDADLLEMMGTIGSQIGLFIKRSRTEEARRSSEARKAAILETALDCVITMDRQGRVVEFNPAAEKTFGYRRQEILGRELAELIIPPSLREAHARGLAHYLATGEGPVLNRRIEITAMRAGGTEFPVELAITPLAEGGLSLFTAYLRDITERKRAEEAITKYIERLRILHQIDRALIAGEGPAAIAAAALVPLREILGVSRAIVNLFDLANGEVEWLAAAGRRRVHVGPGVRYSIRLMGDVEALRRGELQVIDVHALPPGPEVDALLASGVHVYAVVPLLAGGELIGALSFGGASAPLSPEQVSIAREAASQIAIALAQARLHEHVKRQAQELEGRVTELRRAEAELRRTAELLRAVADGTTDAVFVKDRAGRYLLFNEAAARFVGRPAADVLGRDDTELFDPDGARQVMEWDRRVMESGQADTVEEVLTAAGVTRTYLATKAPYRDERGQVVGLLGISRDVTDRKRLEEQLRQAQKMEAVGRLAGGVAHDFNNLLTIITGYGEILLGRLPAGDPSRDLIREIVAAGDRAAGLTRQLLAFSRKAILEPKILDLRALVADVDKMLRRILGEDIQLAVVADPEVGPVKADHGQVEQVLLNLVVNARDAMPTGGRLTIEVRNAALDESYARTHPEARPGPHVLLAVSDTGCGMDAATLARIFEPFFSTKGDKGTGLGLATVHGIAKQSGGHVAVYSEVGHGTTFKVYLPRVDQPAAAGKSSHHGTSGMPRGSETVLLVEDDDSVRSLSRHILKECGYALLEARDGAEAVRVAEGHAGRLDLLLTDVVLPRLGGREAAERIRQARPGLKVLFLSGYTDDAVVRHGILAAEVAFLQKPFSPASLAAKVREVLDSN